MRNMIIYCIRRGLSRYLFPVMMAGILLLCSISLYAQPIITVPYPAPAQALTQSLKRSLLTVQVAFPASCTGTKVTISLPASVSYVPGTVTRTAGTGVPITITESDISNPHAPVFALNGVSGSGDITFTIAREAGCSSTASGKDTVRVSGSCGTVVENAANVNTYNLLTPALSLTAPAAITGAFVGSTYSRTFTVTNGGNGCLDTLWLAIVRPAGSLSAVTLQTGSSLLTAYKTSGDTSFYKVAAADLPGGDSLMCNGETISFQESFRLAGCTGLTSTYMAGWGKNAAALCQVASGSGTITTATGVPNIGATFTRVRNLNWCQSGIFTVRYSNTGSGGNAGAAYSILSRLGYNGTSNATAPSGLSAAMPGKIDSVKIGTVTVPVIAATAAAALQVDFSALTADPDGAGTGLEDLDGDGQYDDLAPGQGVTITVYEHWTDNSSGCPTPAYGFFTGHTLSYKNMCGTSYTTNPLSAAGSYRVQANNGGNITVPAEITGGKPFTIQACVNQASYIAPASRPKDSLYMDIILPPGLSLAPVPNILYNGTAVAAYYIDTVAGVRTLHIARKGKTSAFCFALNLVYDCSAGNVISPQVNIWYQGDTCSQSIERHMCKTASIKSSCAAPCPDGILNYLPFVNRLSLGYTDATMSTRVSPASVTGLARYTAVPLDTIQLIVPGKQGAVAGLFNNLYYNLQFGRIASADVFQFIGGTFNQVTALGTTSSTMAAPLTTGSTAALQKLSWNLSANLNAGVISTGDSVWLDLRFLVTRANNDQLYGANLLQVPNTNSTLYNLNLSGNPVGCDTGHAINLLVTGNGISNYTPAITVSNCNVTTTTSNSYHGNNSGLDIFPAEYRPQSVIDSVLITLPVGYSLSPATTSFSSIYWATLTSYGSNPSSPAGIVSQRSATTWMVSNPNLASGGWVLSDMGNSAYGSNALAYNIAPTCASVIGTQSYSAKWYYRDFVYTGNPAVYASKNYTVNAAITYNATVIPSLTVQNNTGVVQGVLPQQYWDVQLNSTGTGTPPYVWMALDAAGSGINVDSVIYDGANITAAGIAYGTGKTWYQLSAGGIASGSNKKARIYFKYSNCIADSIKMLAGWNCTGYPVPDPAANSCTEIAQYLKVIPQPSQVQLSVLRQPGGGARTDLCTADSILVIVNSAQSANLVDPYVDIIAPQGVTISTPVMIEFPAGSGNYQAAAVTAISGGYRAQLAVHTAIGANGIPGTVINPGSNGRQAKLKINYTTDCSIISGYPIGLIGYGKRPCSSVAIGNGISLNTAGINITGATTTGAAGLTIDIPVSAISCSTTVAVNLVARPVITPSQAGDTVVYTLPRGIVYAGGFNTGYNCNTCAVVTAPGTAGTTLVKVGLQAGIAASDSLKFSFNIGAGAENCGAVNILGNATRNISGLMCGAIACTGNKVVIGTAASPAITLSKPEIVITNMAIDSAHWVAGQYQHVYLYYRNNGTAAYSANTDSVELFCGSSATPFAVRALGKSLAPGAADSQQYWIFIPKSACATGDLVTAKVQIVTASGSTQCLCAPSSYLLNGVSLPLAFLGASARAQDCAVLLDWTYNNTTGIMPVFEIERLNGGVPQRIGTATTANRYVDAQPLPGRSYYRIKAIDAAGKAVYSSTLPVQADDCGGVSVSLYPNPAHDELYLETQGMNTGTAYALVNMMGQVVRQGALAGTGKDKIEVQGLPQGVYLVRIDNNGTLISRQCTITH